MKKIDNKIIEIASQALIDTNIVTNNQYQSEFGGYISSLGAAIIQSGLLPAMIFFENEDAEAKDRHKVIKTIIIIINNCRVGKNPKAIDTTIVRYILDNPNDSDLLREIIDAATAMKLALRMYKKNK